jgi:uncharacterized 2Fe-2S/4Fe-4S cluster protein (DUF4445 family)
LSVSLSSLLATVQLSFWHRPTLEGRDWSFGQHQVFSCLWVSTPPITLLYDAELPEPGDQDTLAALEGLFDDLKGGLDRLGRCCFGQIQTVKDRTCNGFSCQGPSPLIRYDETGLLEFELVSAENSETGHAITLTQKDVRAVQLAKGA